jgi:hypothetical protein
MSHTDIYEYTKAGTFFCIHRNVASGNLDTEKLLALIDMGLRGTGIVDKPWTSCAIIGTYFHGLVVVTVSYVVS